MHTRALLPVIASWQWLKIQTPDADELSVINSHAFYPGVRAYMCVCVCVCICVHHHSLADCLNAGQTTTAHAHATSLRSHVRAESRYLGSARFSDDGLHGFLKQQYLYAYIGN